MIRKLRPLFALTIGIALLAGGFPAARADDNPARSPCAPEHINVPGCGEVSVFGTEMRALAALMARYPAPSLAPIPVDEQELFNRSMRKVLEPAPVYDAPGGAQVGNLPQGFVFVSARAGYNGWARIGEGQYVADSALGPVNAAISRFSGVTLPGSFPAIPFGWVLQDTRPSRTPGARPLEDTPKIRRYTLVNIFAVQIVDGWEWYLVGPDQWVLQTRTAKIKPVARPEGVSGKWFAVDLYEQTLVAYIDDAPVFATLIASGLSAWSTTEGVHQIVNRYKRAPMTGAAGEPEYWYLPAVPYMLYFTDTDQAIHGAYWHDGFGYRRSRGCVNVTITDAKWAYDWTEDAPNAYVFVYESGVYRSGAPE